MRTELAKSSVEITSNINWILIEKFSKTFIAGTLSILVARYLGPANFGELSLALAILAIGMILAGAGVDRILLKELESGSRSEILGSATALRFIAAVFSCAIVNCVAAEFYQNQPALRAMLHLMSSAFLFHPLAVLESYYRFSMKGKLIASIRFWGIFSSSTLKLGLIYFDAEFLHFAIPFVLEIATSSSLFLYFYLREGFEKSEVLRSKVQIMRSQIAQSWPLMLSALIGALYFHLDKVIINQFVSASALGVYAFYFSLIAMITYLVQSINLGFLPDLNARFFSGYQEFWERYETVTAIKLLVLIPVLVVFDFVIAPVIPIIVGAEYSPPSGLLCVFYVYLIFVALGSLSIEYYILEHRTRLLLLFRVVTLLVNVAANLLLIPRVGSVGAALSMMICYLLANFLLPMCFSGYRAPVLRSVASVRLLLSANFYQRGVAQLQAMVRP